MNSAIVEEFMGLPSESLSFKRWRHSPHVKILDLISDGSICLDVGCASGYFARELKVKNCKVYGVEVDPKLAEEAREHCVDVLNADMERVTNLPFEVKKFDVVILSDSLEHMMRPDLVLRKLREIIKPHGSVIASIPNVARIEVRLRLLAGHFDYQESGILSKSHLRFFTLKTIRRLFESAGYAIGRIEPTGLGSIVRVFPTLLAYQFIVVATPNSYVA
jgi:methionine biosynthesis protein MetW